jgi:hypothetical protein
MTLLHIFVPCFMLYLSVFNTRLEGI